MAHREERRLGLLFRRRRPLIRLAAGAAVGTVAYQAGKKSVPVAAAPAVPDETAELERLASLHTSGALTDAEFSVAKSKLLGI
jgi:hypothetical protein